MAQTQVNHCYIHGSSCFLGRYSIINSSNRYARITGSTLYDASRCQTLDGSLVNMLFGAKLRRPTPAMERGTALESQVFKRVQALTRIPFQHCGLFLSPSFPLFGASPDGISKDHVMEIKCPVSEKSRISYINAKGEITNKYRAQMQLEMLLSKRDSALFCVAHHNFESNKIVTIMEEKFDKLFVDQLIAEASAFWEKAVWPK